jgi:hypothetical protein
VLPVGEHGGARNTQCDLLHASAQSYCALRMFFNRRIIAVTSSIRIGSPPNYAIAPAVLRQELNNVMLSKLFNAFLHDVLRILSRGGQRWCSPFSTAAHRMFQANPAKAVTFAKAAEARL